MANLRLWVLVLCLFLGISEYSLRISPDLRVLYGVSRTVGGMDTTTPTSVALSASTGLDMDAVVERLRALDYDVTWWGGKPRIKTDAFKVRPQALELYALLASMDAVDRVEVKNEELGKRLGLAQKQGASVKALSNPVTHLLSDLEAAGLIVRTTLAGTSFPTAGTKEGEAKRFIEVVGVDSNIPETAVDLIGTGAIASEIIDAFDGISVEARIDRAS